MAARAAPDAGALRERVAYLTQALERAESELAFRATELDMLKATWSHAVAGAMRQRVADAAANLDEGNEPPPGALRAVLEDQQFLLAQVDRLERALQAERAAAATRASSHRHGASADAGGDMTATTPTPAALASALAAAAEAKAATQALQAKLAVAEADVALLKRENAILTAAVGSAVPPAGNGAWLGASPRTPGDAGDSDATPRHRLPGMIADLSYMRSAERKRAGEAGGRRRPLLAESETGLSPSSSASGAGGSVDLAVELRAAQAEIARLKEYSAFHINYWRSTADTLEGTVARLRAEKELAHRRAVNALGAGGAGPMMNGTATPSTDSVSDGGGAYALSRTQTPLPLSAVSSSSHLVASPGLVRRAPLVGLPLEMVSMATQTDDPDEGGDGSTAPSLAAAVAAVDPATVRALQQVR